LSILHSSSILKKLDARSEGATMGIRVYFALQVKGS
jgi:hypothetical protein